MDASQRLLDTGTPYCPFELAGPYVIGDGSRSCIRRPRSLLFIPFLWLPPILWCAIPIAIIVWAVLAPRRRCGPGSSSLAASAFAAVDLNVYVFGNPSMWIVAAIAAGTIWRWPFVFVFAKPTFAPIALLGSVAGAGG